MRLDIARLTEIRFLVNSINSSGFSNKFKTNMYNTVVRTYRREYMTDIAGHPKSEQDRLRSNFDTLYPIRKEDKDKDKDEVLSM